ncbi:hypothetical protein CsSME_00020018 [Camellia sinensis var. sinensis]
MERVPRWNIIASVYDGKETDWQWLWKKKFPQKLIGFLWTILHGKLLPNSMRLKRGLSDNSCCPFCSENEDLNHLFRACHKAKEVWTAVQNQHWYLQMLDEPWRNWLFSNSKSKAKFGAKSAWSTVFLVTLWKIWKNRTLKVLKANWLPRLKV